MLFPGDEIAVAERDAGTDLVRLEKTLHDLVPAHLAVGEGETIGERIGSFGGCVGRGARFARLRRGAQAEGQAERERRQKREACFQSFHGFPPERRERIH